MALSAIGAYASSQGLRDVAIVAAVFGLVNIPSVGTWVVLGRGMRLLPTHPRRMQAFNVAMAVLLVAFLVPILQHKAGMVSPDSMTPPVAPSTRAGQPACRDR